MLAFFKASPRSGSELVRDVLGLCAFAKVTRIAAQRQIARMTYDLIVCELTVPQLIDNAMREQMPRASSALPNPAVAVCRMPSADVEPAIVRSDIGLPRTCDLCLESLS